MSVRQTSSQYVAPNNAELLRQNLNALRAANTQHPESELESYIATNSNTNAEQLLRFDDLTPVEQSAASIGEHPDALKPIQFLNAGHYTELLNQNRLSGRLTQQIESYKIVSARG
jgi:hypothetical protein